MPKQKGKDGKMFSTHGVVKPKLTVKASCLGCHRDSTVEKKLYEIESIINYTKGKMRTAYAHYGYKGATKTHKLPSPTSISYDRYHVDRLSICRYNAQNQIMMKGKYYFGNRQYS